MSTPAYTPVGVWHTLPLLLSQTLTVGTSFLSITFAYTGSRIDFKLNYTANDISQRLYVTAQISSLS